MSNGGSAESISIAGRNFAVDAEADLTMDLGGFSNEKKPNGNKSSRTIKMRKLWSIEGLAIAIDFDQGDLEFLQEIADKSEDVAIAVTLVANVTYSGTGTITGDIKVSTQNATATISVGGHGELRKQ